MARPDYEDSMVGHTTAADEEAEEESWRLELNPDDPNYQGPLGWHYWS